MSNNINNKLDKLKESIGTVKNITIQNIIDDAKINKNTKLTTQMEVYDKKKIDGLIIDYSEIKEQQLHRLKKLRNTNEPDLANKSVTECKKFMDDNGENIKKQLLVIKKLEQDIKTIVVKADELEDNNKMLKNLINSEPYVQLANDIKEIKTSIDNLTGFLVRRKIINPKG